MTSSLYREDSFLAFADAGADVGVSSRTLSELKEVAEGARARGHRGLPFLADAGDMDDLTESIGKVLSEFGRIDIFVNDAGRSSDSPRRYLTCDMKEIKKVTKTGNGLTMCQSNVFYP
ncbi:MAG: SDR family oxidoreductase [Deltaproteobacteria bacterium]|nr:SDR family oxidoreductase [Deltaproteobacteria bacterium]